MLIELLQYIIVAVEVIQWRPAVEEFENLEIIGKLQNIGDHMEVQFDLTRNSASVYENSNSPLTATYNLINGTTNNVNEGNCESESDEDCASNENEIFDTDTVEDTGVVEKGRGSLTKCIVYSVEGNIPEKHRIGLAVASNINDLDMESDDENPLQCNLCCREFTTAYKMEIHNCKGAFRQDLISQAIVYAKDIY
ncbi:Hypothetical predicted protein [Octopus vulgaris]|uniref:Uncharacterized protein n=1 Tax=Octopus vulgaris TaxID=6645 RepID=A0AA36AWR4_OCTVU|nr:Hypothetical predicted protein [Octopus vulgaris]